MPNSVITPTDRSANGNVNTTLGFNQIASVLSSIVSLATGQSALSAATNTSEFVSQAQTGLLAGYDNLLGAITQTLSKTIFSIRPYSAKFKELSWDRRKWGNHVRKINFCDTGLEEDNRFGRTVNDTWTEWDDGDSVDMYNIKKPSVIQTNWYNASQYQKHYTIFRDQLDNAFKGPEEFQGFVSGVVSTVSDEMEQAREEFTRAILANYIGALYAQSTGISPRDNGKGRLVKLCTEFCTEMGLNDSIGSGDDDTYATAREAALSSGWYDSFIKWMFARLAVLSDLMTERSMLFHSGITPTGGSEMKLMRHTPYEKQRLYLFTDTLKNIDTRVLSAAFHDNYLKIGKHSTVSYWQSLLTRDKVIVTPSTIDAAGGYSAGSSTTVENIFGILFDEEAIGISQGSTWSAASPFNARGGYSNMFFHETVSGLNDMTENGILLLLE